MAIMDSIRRAQNTLPVDVEGLAAELGVRVHRAWLSDGISGELVCSQSGKYQINVNASDAYTRQRFTISHELGHYVYHRHLIGEGIDDDRAYRSTDAGRYHNTNIGPKQETQANKFAAGLLMPDHLLYELEEMDLSLQEKAVRLGVSQHALSIRLGASQ
jgi:Zn-dependent peptidase ImmA (M78 family)